jgi:hypothetical protein
MIDYIQILTINYAGKQWSIVNNSYDGLDWLDSSPKPTQAELDALAIPTQDAVAKENCSSTAKSLLANSDWSQLPDVGLANVSDYVTYRGILRGYVLQPVIDPVWPTEPTPIWA